MKVQTDAQMSQAWPVCLLRLDQNKKHESTPPTKGVLLFGQHTILRLAVDFNTKKF